MSLVETVSVWHEELRATAAESHHSCASLVSRSIPPIAVAIFNGPYSELTSKATLTIHNLQVYMPAAVSLKEVVQSSNLIIWVNLLILSHLP